MCAALVSPTDSGMGSPPNSGGHPHPHPAYGGPLGLRNNPNLANIPTRHPHPHAQSALHPTSSGLNGGGGGGGPGDPPPDVLLALLSRNRALEATIPRCAGCDGMILDRFILKVADRTWHSRCLKCNECDAHLDDKCFVRNGQLYCKEDFFKRFGTRCAVCEQGIPPTQVVRRAQDNVYHLQCFVCILCSRQLNTGDEFYLMEDRKLVCKSDYDAAKSKGQLLLDGNGCSDSGGDAPNKRPRTTITAKQLETLKSAYNASPKPARHVREQLSADTGLDMRVVQVWFQNRRAKEKRLKKDAGRSRWGQYFRTLKGSKGDNRSDIMKDSGDKSDSESGFNHSDLSSNDGFVDMPEITGGPGTPSQHGAYNIGNSSSPYSVPHHDSSNTPSMHHFPHFTPDGIPVYPPLGVNGTTSGSPEIGPPGGPRSAYQDYPPSPASWLSDDPNQY